MTNATPGRCSRVTLAQGIPWAHAAEGGRAALDDGSLFGAYRAMSAGAGLVPAWAAVMLPARAGVAPRFPRSNRGQRVAASVVAVFIALSALGASRLQAPSSGG